MNDPNRPLSPDIVGELLSADIDGEFARAATELGFTPADARAALDASPDTATRRAALQRARDLIATRPRLDQSDALRLVESALDRSSEDLPVSRPLPRRIGRPRFENAWRVLVAAGSAAAIIAAIVVVSANNPGGGSKSTTSPAFDNGARAASPETSSLANGPHSIEFGDVSAPAALRAKVRSELRIGPGSYSTAAPVTKSADSTAGNEGAKSNIEPPTSPAPPGGVAACIAASARAAHVPATAALSGTGTYAGKPVVVAVFRRGVSYLVYVTSVADCSVVAHETVP